MSYGRPHKSRPGHPVIGGLQFLHPISTTSPMTLCIIGDLHERIRIRTCTARGVCSNLSFLALLSVM